MHRTRFDTHVPRRTPLLTDLKPGSWAQEAVTNQGRVPRRHGGRREDQSFRASLPAVSQSFGCLDGLSPRHDPDGAARAHAGQIGILVPSAIFGMLRSPSRAPVEAITPRAFAKAKSPTDSGRDPLREINVSLPRGSPQPDATLHSRTQRTLTKINACSLRARELFARVKPLIAIVAKRGSSVVIGMTSQPGT